MTTVDLFQIVHLETPMAPARFPPDLIKLAYLGPLPTWEPRTPGSLHVQTCLHEKASSWPSTEWFSCLHILLKIEKSNIKILYYLL